MGQLFVVSTPIGNLGDMTPRAVTVLKEVDLIAAEDTRHSAKLLQHFGIGTPLCAFHDHNERRQAASLISQIQEGKNIALISDAGTPLVSDPGYNLVAQAREQGVEVTPVPGVSAAIAALSVAGLASDRFVFEGFLPAKTNARCNRLERLRTEARTLIFYESPHRVEASITDMAQVFGYERKAVAARELTKRFETIESSSLGGLLQWVQENPSQQRGEWVLLVAGADDEPAEDDGAAEHVLRTLLAELPVKQAAALAAKITGGSKNKLYQQALQIKADG